MSKGTVIAICISPRKREPMQSVPEVMALERKGLSGDRYAEGDGSYNQGSQGKRQVTLINGLFVQGSGFEYHETRRNIATIGVELMDLIGKEFRIGEATLRGVKYCDPCLVPSALSGKKTRFNEVFHDRGGLIAEVVTSGLICVGDPVIPPNKGY